MQKGNKMAVAPEGGIIKIQLKVVECLGLIPR